jgi:hypothetical protein
VPDWILFSIVASIALTVVLNVALRLVPGARQLLADLFVRSVDRAPTRAEASDEPRVRVIVPWKLMLVVSLIATLVLNMVLRLG